MFMDPEVISSKLVIFISVVVDGQVVKQWCIADEQYPDEELQRDLDWACGSGRANCSAIQENQPCYYPNTVRDHASYAFNSYWQKFKNQGGSCKFNAAALLTELDPSNKNPLTNLILMFFLIQN